MNFFNKYKDKSIEELKEIKRELKELRVQYWEEWGRIYPKVEEFNKEIKPLDHEIKKLRHKLTALHHYFWRRKNPNAETRLKELIIKKEDIEEERQPFKNKSKIIAVKHNKAMIEFSYVRDYLDKLL